MGTIAQEIQRIQGAKADLKTAIEAKGVTVPSSALIDDYADLVDEIEQGGGGNLTSLNVTPSTSAQQITPTSPVDGYDEVNVSAVTSAIDSNIAAGNIKKGVSILGVTGTFYSFDLAGLKLGTKTTITKEDGDYLASFMSKARAYYSLFYGITTITSADYSGVTTLSTETCMQSTHQNNTGLTSVDFSNLASATGSSALRNAFSGCTRLTSIAFPSLVEIGSTYALYLTFQNCTSLASISFPALTTIPTATNSNWARQTFDGCTGITSATVHPATLQNSAQYLNLLGSVSASTFTTLRLSAEATDNVYLSWAAHLDSTSILDVLNHLSTEATGKTCAFANLTVASSDPNYAAISAKVAALTNWTITGLTL